MDYLKTLYLINTSSNKDEVFMYIYKVTRNYIQDTLFKYCSLIDDIQLNKRKLDSVHYFNQFTPVRKNIINHSILPPYNINI